MSISWPSTKYRLSVLRPSVFRFQHDFWDIPRSAISADKQHGFTFWLEDFPNSYGVETLWRRNLAAYPWLSCGERQGWHLTSKTHRDSKIGSAWWFGSWSDQPFEQKLVKIGKLAQLLGWKPSVICDETGYDLPKISWAPPNNWTYVKPSNVKTKYTIMLSNCGSF